MKPVPKLFVILWLANCILPNALAAPPEANAVITQVLEVSGLTKAVQNVPAQLQEVIAEEPNIQNMPPERRTALQSALTRAFTPSLILEIITRTLHNNYNEAQFQQFIQLYQEPLTRKFRALESETDTPQGLKDKQVYIAKLSTSPATANRLEMLRELDRLTHDSAASTNILVGIARTMTGALVIVQPVELRPSPEQIEAFLANFADQLRASIAPSVTLSTQQSYLYAYRDASDAELMQYIKSYDNPAIQWCLFLVEQGLQSALEEASAIAIKNSNETQSNRFESST